MFITIKSLILIALFSSLSGCSYERLNCNNYSGTAKYDECFAFRGNKQKQYELGLAAYEAGEMDVALKWLEKAVEPVESGKMIYMPPVGSQSYGTVMRLPKQENLPGHVGAKLLLEHIYNEDVGAIKDLEKEKLNRNMSDIMKIKEAK